MRKIALALGELSDSTIEDMLANLRVAVVCNGDQANRLRKRFEVFARCFELVCITGQHLTLENEIADATARGQRGYQQLELAVGYLGVPNWLIIADQTQVDDATFSLLKFRRLPQIIYLRGHNEFSHVALLRIGYSAMPEPAFKFENHAQGDAFSAAPGPAPLAAPFFSYCR